MAKCVIFWAFMALACCYIATAFEPKPLQDFCVADVNSGGILCSYICMFFAEELDHFTLCIHYYQSIIEYIIRPFNFLISQLRLMGWPARTPRRLKQRISSSAGFTWLETPQPPPAPRSRPSRWLKSLA